jgi:hypothetical protein
LLGALREEQKGGTKADHESFIIKVTERVLFGQTGADAMEGKTEVSGKAPETPEEEPSKPIEHRDESGAEGKSRRGGRGRQLRLE